MNHFIATYINFFSIFFSVVTGVSAQTLNYNAPINGISFLGPQDRSLSVEMFENLRSTNANWVALIPEAILDRETLTLLPDEDNDHWSNTIEGQIDAIKLAKATGLKVFLKPHIKLEGFESDRSYISRRLFPKGDKTKGAYWRGDLRARNESDWKVWEQSYEKYILKLATVANDLDVELFAVGTELREFIKRRPAFWNQLIIKVRKKYTGAITYSANWDEFEKVTFWGELDYIGIDAYFPVSYAKTPSVDQVMKSWQSIKKDLRELHESVGKQILITEYGYRNVSYAGATPWEHDDGSATPNDTAQSNLYEAFYKALWNESWIAGGFCWNWLHTDLEADNTDFSIRNKPAFELIKRWYKKST